MAGLSENSVVSENSVEFDEPTQPEEGSKKRKRDTTGAPELEIDVSLPEPPSKKTLRKAKKAKTSSRAEAKDSVLSEADGEDSKSKHTESLQPSATVDPARSTAHGVWIGNLPWTATKAMVQGFFVGNAGIPEESITRIHIPAPAGAMATKTSLKPQNKGFAYVDFNSEDAQRAALVLSELEFGGRKVLIKDSKSFVGRPEKASKAGGDGVSTSMNKKPSKRVFVGNLSFDVTKDDLQGMYAKCGDVLDIHMATFEDTGKCKGFGWVTFDSEEAATAAVRGWIRLPTEKSVGEDLSHEEQKSASGSEENEAAASNDEKENTKRRAKKQDTRKWFVNRLYGRSIRCEFAEDATTRYKKRFGKDAEIRSSATDAGNALGEQEDSQVDVESVKRQKPKATQSLGMQPGAPTDPNKRRGRTEFKKSSKDGQVKYRTGGITEGTGQKVVFD